MNRTLQAVSAFFTQRVYNTPYLLLVLAPLFWSGNVVLGRAVRVDVPPVGLAFWRWTMATLIIMGFAWPHLKRDWPTIRQHWRLILLLSILGIAVFNTLLYVGLQFTSAVNGALMQSLMPIIIVLISFLLFGEQVTGRQTLGILLSLLGTLTIIAQGSLEVLTTLSLNQGDLLILIATICYAGYSALLRKRPPLHPLSFIGITFIWGTLVLSPFYLWENLTGRVMAFDMVTVLSVGYVAIFPSILSYLCFNRGVELAGANRAGLFIHLVPMFGSLLAILLLGETFRWYHGVGISLILAGIMLATRPGRQKKLTAV